MTPSAPDRGTVTARLRALRETLSELEALRGTPEATFAAEPLIRAATERLIQVVVDLAVDVNGHVVTSVAGAAPQTGYESFLDMARIGAIDEDLAARLAPSAGLRNVLVHRYVEIQLDLVADAVPTVLDGFAQYVSQVADWLAQQR